MRGSPSITDKAKATSVPSHNTEKNDLPVRNKTSLLGTIQRGYITDLRC